MVLVIRLVIECSDQEQGLRLVTLMRGNLAVLTPLGLMSAIITAGYNLDCFVFLLCLRVSLSEIGDAIDMEELHKYTTIQMFLEAVSYSYQRLHLFDQKCSKKVIL